MTDVQLLEKHREGCQTAFAELVRRHLGWICSVARRRIHDVHLAEDVAQAVFIVLHRKAPRFGEDRAMMGWLHRTACYATAAAIKSRYRQRLHERQAALLAPPTTPAQSEPQWEQLAPMLDELVGQLPRPDRDAILLRFYRELTFPQIGAQTGVSEEAARKRVNRALEKLCHLAGRRGMSWSAASLGPILTAKVIRPVSQESMASITTGAGAVSASCAPIVKGVTLMMAYSHAKFAAIAAAVLLIVLSGTLLISRDWNVSAAQRDEQGSAASDARARHGYALLSPFTGARWNGTNYQVLYNGTWYALLAINKQPLATIVDFAQGQYREKWQKRIDEDLVEVLDAIGAPAKVADNDKSGSVSLVLRTLDTKQQVTVDAAPMTEDNRWAVWSLRNPSIEVPNQGPMPTIRWNNDQPQIQVNGTWYDLYVVNRQPMQRIIDFARKTYGDDWKKNIETNLPAILTGMGHAPAEKLTFQLFTLDTPPDGH